MGFLKKKGGDVDEDAARPSLFGSRKSKNNSPAPASNPYAAPQKAADPYAQPQQKPAYGNMPPPAYEQSPNDPRDTWRNNKSPVPPGGYGGGYGGQAPPGPQRFGSNGSGYGQQNGYGQNPYGGGAPRNERPGGYGGLERSNSQETMSTDAGRDQLFGGAAQRHQQQQQMPQQTTASSYGGDQGYGAYQDRQLTAEEEEEEEVTATKQEIKFIKQQDVASTRNALRLAEQSIQVGSETLERLGQQGERIHNTERNLDLSANQNRIAEDKARELKKLNRSMFAVNPSNPFTSKSRREARDAAIVDTHKKERDQREQTRQAAYASSQRQDQFSKELRGAGAGGRSKGNLAERAKYQFEADSEDEDMENEIDNNLDQLHGVAVRMKGLAGAMGREVDEQNKHIERIMGKTDKVDDQIAMNRARLDRIH